MAIAAGERSHEGQLRFVVEASLPLAQVFRGLEPRARALQLFGQLGVWDTEEDSGVLIYVQLVDRRIEIVADRGIAKKVGQAEWDAVCRAMEQAFKQHQYEVGAVEAIHAVTDILALHFPANESNPNELPDKPAVL